jgi:large subunit ribosomal protein L9
MRVILKESISGLGGLGDQVTVKRGYARNYLIPEGKASLATSANLADFEKNKAELAKLAAAALKAAQHQAAALSGLTLDIVVKAGEEGKLFGSVSSKDIAEALVEKGHSVSKQAVVLSEGLIRHTGEYTAVVRMHPEVHVDITVIVAPIASAS